MHSFLLLLVFSSTKLEIRAKQIMPGSEGRWEGEGGCVWMCVGRNGPNNVCTYE
jgi:hypothetical protein